jgi:hypothetical protein
MFDREWTTSTAGACNSSSIDLSTATVGSNIAYELLSPNPIRPISDHRITITLTLTSGLLNPFIGAAEILQFFDEPMAAPTSSEDGMLYALHDSLIRI